MIMSNSPDCIPQLPSRTRFVDSNQSRSSPTSTATMMLFREESLYKVGTPDMDRQTPASPSKPLKSCLKKKARRKINRKDSSSSSSKRIGRSVSFTGLECNKRWESDTPCDSGLPLAQHLRIRRDDDSSDRHYYSNYAPPSPSSPPSNSSKHQSPRLPRRCNEAATTESIPSSSSSAPMPPRRMRSHENLFQHKIDFFLEQLPKKKVESKTHRRDTSASALTTASGKPKDVEELESSLYDMQKFLVALTSVPNNQKVLQKHMEFQTSLQARIEDKKKQEEEEDDEDDEDDGFTTDDDEEDEDDDDTGDESSDDEEDDDEDDAGIQSLIDEIQNRKPIPMTLMGSELFQMLSESERSDGMEATLSF